MRKNIMRIVIAAVLLIFLWMLNQKTDLFNTKIKMDNQKQNKEAPYRPILVTGGRFVGNKSNLDATLLEISSEYVAAKGRELGEGEVSGVRVYVMKPDFSPAKPWLVAQREMLKRKFPDEKELNKQLPVLRNMSTAAAKDYREFRNEYVDRVVKIYLSSPRDIYSLQETYEGSFSVDERARLHKLGEYFGPIASGSKFSRLNYFENGKQKSFLVGKYGEGLWRYKKGFGHDYIQEDGRKGFELLEYPRYNSLESNIPSDFVYIPVVEHWPHKLYIECDWNGNIDYLLSTRCFGKSLYDNTISYSFKFNRTDLNNYYELNERVRNFIESLIVKRSTFSNLISQQKGK